MKQKCIILTVLFMTSFVVSFATPFVVSATSVYDNAYKTTKTLYANNSNNGCSNSNPIDLSKNWYSTILDLSNWHPEVAEVNDNYVHVQQELTRALYDGSWSVTQRKNNGDSGRNQVEVVFNATRKMQLNWNENYTYVNDLGNMVVSISCKDNKPYIAEVGSVSGSNFSISTNYGVFNYLFTGDANYPPGYSGEEIVSSNVPASTLIPSVYATVDDTYMSAVTRSPGWPSDIQPRYEMKIYETDDNYVPIGDPVYDGSDGKSVKVHGTWGSVFDYDFKHHGKYLLKLNHYVKPPFAPLDPKKYQTKELQLSLNIDGSSFTFDTATGKNVSCGDDGKCTPPSVYQVCEYENITIGSLEVIYPNIDTIACWANNVGAWLRSLITYLFIPNFAMLRRESDDFSDDTQKKLGFVYQSGNIISTSVGSLTNSINHPDCVLDFQGSIGGQSPNLDLCSLRNTIGTQAFDFALMLVRGVIAIGFVTFSYSYVSRFLHGKNNGVTLS